MFTVARRQNLIPFFLILGLGVSLTLTLPPNLFPNQVFEIPTFALFFAEVALAFILSVLFFENAGPAEAFRISFVILTIAMMSGGIGNIVGRVSQGLPDSVLLLNWVQLVAMNVTGLASTMAFLEIRYTDQRLFNLKKERAQAEAQETTIPPVEAAAIPDTTASKAESVKDILDKLDVRRINSLEKSLKESSSASLEALFTEETEVTRDIPKGIIALPSGQPEDKTEEKVEHKIESKIEDKKEEKKDKLFDDASLSQSVDDVFANLAPQEAQKDFSPAVETNEASSTEVKAKDTKISKEVEKFGRLSTNIAKSEPSTPGTLKTIGQMLLDTQAIENIIRQGEIGQLHFAGAKIITISDGANIDALLKNACNHPDILGGLIIGPDGLLLGASQEVSSQKDILGQLTLAIHSSSNLVTKQLALGDLRQIVLKSEDKLTILSELKIGERTNVLAVLSDTAIADIDQILSHLEKVLSGSSAEEAQAISPVETPVEIPAETNKVETPVNEAAASVETESPKEEIKQSEGKTAEGKTISLFNVSDDEVSDLFDHLMAQPKAAETAPAAEPAAAKAAEPPTAEAKAESNIKSLFNVTDDDMSAMFDNLLAEPESQKEIPKNTTSPAEPTAPAAPEAPANPAVDFTPSKSTVDNTAMKEFGRLSANAANKLSSEHDQGTIKAIGKQLIDVQAVENIIKAGESPETLKPGLTTARVISAARGEGIRTLLKQIDNFPGVSGSLIVGSDGLVIATTLSDEANKELLGVMCNSMLGHSDLAVDKFDIGKLRQMVLLAPDKTTILTTVAVGVLAVFLESSDITKIDDLLATIDTTVRG